MKISMHHWWQPKRVTDLNIHRCRNLFLRTNSTYSIVRSVSLALFYDKRSLYVTRMQFWMTKYAFTCLPVTNTCLETLIKIKFAVLRSISLTILQYNCLKEKKALPIKYYFLMLYIVIHVCSNILIYNF